MPREIPKSPAYVIAYAAIVSAAFTFAIMALHVASQDRVRANEKLLLEKAIVDLFALGDVETLNGAQIADLVRRRVAGYADDDAEIGDARREPIAIHDPVGGAAIPLLVAFREDLTADETPPIFDRTRLLGYAFPIGGQGFWAPIEGWLALSSDLTATLGIVFLKHSETPGLGGRITEAEFRDQFRPTGRANGRGLQILPGLRSHAGGGATAAAPPSGGGIVSARPTDRSAVSAPSTPETWSAVPAPIVIDHQRLMPADPGYGQHVVAITGATGTSDAVEAFLNRGLVRFYRAARASGLLQAGVDEQHAEAGGGATSQQGTGRREPVVRGPIDSDLGRP